MQKCGWLRYRRRPPASERNMITIRETAPFRIRVVAALAGARLGAPEPLAREHDVRRRAGRVGRALPPPQTRPRRARIMPRFHRDGAGPRSGTRSQRHTTGG